jgi:hypothetical protein
MPPEAQDFLLADAPNAPERAPAHNVVPLTASTRHRPSTDIGIDLVGYTFTDRVLVKCKVVAPSTYVDENNIVWNTLEFTSRTYPSELQIILQSQRGASVDHERQKPSTRHTSTGTTRAATFDTGPHPRAPTANELSCGPQLGATATHTQV